MDECLSTKREGKQREFCEEKYLEQDGERTVVACFANFCTICCGEDEKECFSKCLTTHVDPKSGITDPEEIFMNVCSSEKLIETMHPFCEKFYSVNQNSYKMCQSSFCYDCCISELKIEDQKDSEVQRCASRCLEAIRKLDSEADKPSSKGKASSVKKMAPDDENDEEESVPRKLQKREQERPKTVKRQAEPEVSEEDEERETAKRRKKAGPQCSGGEMKTIYSQFCAAKFDPNSDDYRYQSIDTCKSYFCPLCCSEAFSSGNDILECQRKCHVDMMSLVSQDAPKSPAQETGKTISKFKENSRIAPEAPPDTAQPSVNPSNEPTQELDADEKSFLATVCQSFKTHKCFEEICEIGCRENYKNVSLVHCIEDCASTMKDSNFNPTAVKILKFFIEKITKPMAQAVAEYNFKNVMGLEESGLGAEKTIEQQIDEAQAEIKREKTQLLDSQARLLELQKLKNKSFEKG